MSHRARSRTLVRVLSVLFLSALSACGGGSSALPDTAGATTGETPSRGPLAVVRAASAAGELLTGFDAGEALLPTADGQSMSLQDLGSGSLVGLPIDAGGVGYDPGPLVVQFQGGDETQRRARIVADPTNATNRVLSFEIDQANVSMADGSKRGRVQLNAYAPGAAQAREMRFTTRMYLPADVGLLRGMTGTFDWLTISEWWNDAAWTDSAYPFRVSLNLVKPLQRRGTPLYLQARAQTMDVDSQRWTNTVWQVTNRSVPIPIGQWVTLEYSYLEGNASTGRFYLAMTPDGGRRVVLFDIRSWTQHPSDPAPDGLSHVNPLKLYTSSQIVDYVHNAGGVLSVLWDDLSFRLCTERGPESTSPCAPNSFP
jgi:hypothetical protein